MPDELISVAQARAIVRDAALPLDDEPVAIADADGRGLREDVRALADVPPFVSSAMDGFAVVSRGASRELAVVGESRAGAPFGGVISPTDAVRISTGAVLPAGADAVVALERAEEPAAGRVLLHQDAAPGLNVRGAGEDMRAGEIALVAGRRLGAAELGVAVAAGRAELRCARRPRVAIVASGDELRPPGAALGPGEIHNSNAVTLQALARRAGAEPTFSAGAADELGQTEAVLGEAIAGADVLVVSGGVSVGPHDHVKAALQALGVQERFWRVALRPGKPTWFGIRDRTLVFGLPGNPVSAMVTFLLFVSPALSLLQGVPPDATHRTATLGESYAGQPDRDEAVRVALVETDEGLRAVPTGPQGSHQLTSMLDANGLVIVPAGHPATAGDRVRVEPI